MLAFNKLYPREFLAFQWLGLQASIARGQDSTTLFRNQIPPGCMVQPEKQQANSRFFSSCSEEGREGGRKKGRKAGKEERMGEQNEGMK